MVGKQRRRLRALPLVLMLAIGLLLAACGGEQPSSSDNNGTATPEVEDPAAPQNRDENGVPEAGGKISIGYITWDEDIAATYLWKVLLEERGYEVEPMQMDVAPVFAGVAGGTVDLFFDVWMPSTHSDYMEQFGDDVEIVGEWFDQADLGLAVPDYVDVQSIADLAEAADQFDATIVGIEPGAGLMRITRENAMPGYGLEDWTLVESSTQAMLAQLERSVQAQQPIVVTLWRPHWAFGQYPIRYLEDPEGLMNPEGAERVQIIARNGFSAKYPEVVQWLGNFQMNQDDLAQLEIAVLGAADEEEGAKEWLQDHRSVVDAWFE